MMAEMLSFLDSRSTAHVLEEDGLIAFPDENYARKIMQLFSIGINKLEMDGSTKLDSYGTPIPTYDNSDIQTFARAWTGFTRQDRRGNLEAIEYLENRIDPMLVEGETRAVFPKMDLNDGFIGDTYPLCVDKPDHQFLRVGATYRLLGSSNTPELQHESNLYNYKDVKRLQLDTQSNLYGALCNQSNGACKFQAVVNLDTTLECFGVECFLDNNLHVVEVQQNPHIYYEYVGPPCV